MRSIAIGVMTMVSCGVLLIGRPAAGAEAITLSEAIDRALKFAPSLAAAAANSDLSEAQMREARAPLWPGVSAQGEYQQTPGFDEVVTNRGQTDTLLTLDYTAFDFGRRLAQQRAARYASEAARLGVAAARAQIVFDTKAAYFDLLRSRNVQRELESSLDRLTRYVAITKALVQSGRAIASDALKVQVARDDAELALAAARRTRDQAAIILGSLIGSLGQTDLQAAEIERLEPAPTGDISRSPGLAAAIRQVQSASQEETAAEAERYPTFKIALTTGFLGVDPPDTFRNRGGASYDGLVSVPIFAGGAIAARVDEARARVRLARAEQRATQLDLSRRVAEASLAYQRAREALEILSRAQPTADDAFALSWARFLGGGGVTMLEVLDSYQQAERIRIDRMDQEFAAHEAAAQSGLALGLTE